MSREENPLGSFFMPENGLNMVFFRASCEIAGGSFFIYHKRRNEVIPLDSFDNDELLLMLDDDLFWRDDDVSRVQSESCESRGW